MHLHEFAFLVRFPSPRTKQVTHKIDTKEPIFLYLTDQTPKPK